MTTLDKIAKSVQRYRPLIESGLSVVLLGMASDFVRSGDYSQGLISGCLSIISGYDSYRIYNQKIKE